MSERWRKKLRDLDNAGPSDEVFDRAKQGPTHGDESLPNSRTSTRIVTVVVAFLVFVLAISAFAIPILRMNGTDAGSESLGLFPIWPAQSSDDLEALQAQSDDWVRSPQGVAVRFGQDVMGWPDAIAQEIPQSTCYEVANASASPSPSAWMGCDAVAIGSLAPVPGGQFGYAPVSGPPSGYPTSVQSPGVGDAFVRYVVFQCACDLAPSSEVLTLYQPLEQGDGQIWAVLEARYPDTNLSVLPSQIVHDGSTIAAHVPHFGEPIVAYSACDASGGSTVFSRRETIYGGFVDARQGSIEVSLPGSETCIGPTPGYAWAAVAKQDPSGSDPIAGRPPEGLVAFTAVPIVALFPERSGEDAITPTASTVTASPASLEWTSYADALGWTMDVPAGWRTTKVDQTDPGAVFRGSVDGVDTSISVVHIEGGAFRPPQDDSRFPLDPADLTETDGGLDLVFHGDGLPFIFEVGGPLSDAQQAVVDRMIRSIAFQPWAIGDLRNGWTAVGEVHPSATAEWITYQGDSYLSYIGGEGDGGRVVYGPAPRCLPGEPQPLLEVRETGVAAITCQDGQTGEWRFDSGEPGSTNDQRFADPLPKHRAILSWDGFLLVDLASTIQ